MRRSIIAIIFFLPLTIFCQKDTYIGLEFGPKFEIYQAIDNGDALYTQPFMYSPIFGARLGQELHKNFAIETGFYINDYGESYRLEGAQGYGSSNAILAYQIPLRLKPRIRIIKKWLDLVGTIGYTFAINNDFGSTGRSGASITSNNFSWRTESESNYSLARTYGLLETGLALEFHIIEPLSMHLSANYLKGFQRVVEADVTYWINADPPQTGQVFSNGDYYSVVFGLTYNISHLWREKDKQQSYPFIKK